MKTIATKLKSITFEQTSYWSLVIFALALPLSRGLLSFFIFWFVLLVIAKRDYKSSLNTLKENRIFIYIALFLLWMFMMSLFTEDPSKATRYVRMYSYWIIVPAIVILAKKEWLYNILNAFLIGMFISELISYGIYFEILTLEGVEPDVPSPFMNRIHYSVFLAFTSLVLLYRLLFENRSLRFKIVVLLFFLTTTTNLMISTGRLGQLAFFVTLFLVFIIRYKLSIKTLLISTLFLIAVSFVSYNTLDLFKSRAHEAINDIKIMVEKQDFHSSWGQRFGYWIIAYDAVKEKPIIGHGLGSSVTVASSMIKKHNYKYFSRHVKKFLSTHNFHNQYLMVLVETGVVGLALFLLLFYKLYKSKIEDLELKHIGMIGLTVYFISFIGESMLTLQFPLMLFLFIVSFVIVSSKKEDAKESGA